jgi:hypothetical protein
VIKNHIFTKIVNNKSKIKNHVYENEMVIHIKRNICVPKNHSCNCKEKVDKIVKRTKNENSFEEVMKKKHQKKEEKWKEQKNHRRYWASLRIEEYCAGPRMEERVRRVPNCTLKVAKWFSTDFSYILQILPPGSRHNYFI